MVHKRLTLRLIRTPRPRRASFCPARAGVAPGAGAHSSLCRPSLACLQQSRGRVCAMVKPQGHLAGHIGPREMLTQFLARIHQVLAGDRSAPLLLRQVVGLAHDEADEFRRGLLHQRLGAARDLGFGGTGQLFGHDPCDVGQGQITILCTRKPQRSGSGVTNAGVRCRARVPPHDPACGG